MGMPKSRSASPAPSLEAAILHTKRRRSVASPGVAASPGSGSSTSAEGSGVASGSATGTTEREPRARMKGAFKSSPLASVGSDANVVVAEEIRNEKEKEKREREQEAKEKEKEKGDG